MKIPPENSFFSLPQGLWKDWRPRPMTNKTRPEPRRPRAAKATSENAESLAAHTSSSWRLLATPSEKGQRLFIPSQRGKRLVSSVCAGGASCHRRGVSSHNSLLRLPPGPFAVSEPSRLSLLSIYRHPFFETLACVTLTCQCVLIGGSSCGPWPSPARSVIVISRFSCRHDPYYRQTKNGLPCGGLSSFLAVRTSRSSHRSQACILLAGSWGCCSERC